MKDTSTAVAVLPGLGAGNRATRHHRTPDTESWRRLTDKRMLSVVATRLLGVRPSQLRWRAWLRRFLPAAILTCVVALYNQFPLTYSDTGNYVGNAVSMAHGREPWFFFRPLTYILFLVPFSRPQTIWLVPLAQGLLVVIVVDLALRSAEVSLTDNRFLGLFAGLTAFTSLPWFSGQIMPDIFTSLVILLPFIALRGGEEQTRRQRLILGAILAFSIATHLSHFLLYGLLLITGLAAAVIAHGSRCWPELRRLGLRAIVPLLVATGLVMAPNYYFYHEPVLSRSSALFVLGHLVGEGLAQRYLENACPTRHYLLCSERASLVPNVDWFLWSPGGTRKRHEPEMQRGDSTFLREAPAIVAGTLRQEWAAVIGVSLKNAAAQLRTFEIHPEEHRYSRAVEQEIKPLGNRVVQAYRASGEAQKSLPLVAANRVQYTVFGFSVLVLLACLPMLRGPAHSGIRALIAVVGIGVVLNAFVVVSLASVRSRYQSRVVWLVPLVAAVAAGRVVGSRGRRGLRNGDTLEIQPRARGC
jgi:hypothetical protein